MFCHITKVFTCLVEETLILYQASKTADILSIVQFFTLLCPLHIFDYVKSAIRKTFQKHSACVSHVGACFQT